MDNSDSPSKSIASEPLSPDEAFALLGNETRVDILQVLWDAFESGKGGNVVSYSELFGEVDYDDSGNFSYHLEKLTGPFVRKTADGYELKQTGINVVRAVVAGTVIGDPAFGPTRIDVACPVCGAPVEVAYMDELMTVSCTDCEGMLRWNDEPGFLFLGLVPPAFNEQRPVEAAFRAAVTHTFHDIAAMYDGVCPHCAGCVETTVDVCHDHDPGPETLCSNCERRHLADAWMVCATCKRSAFPPVGGVVLNHPTVIAFYHGHGIEHRTATWERIVRSTEVEEELRSEDPLRLCVTIPAGDDELQLTLDDGLDVVETVQ